MSSVVGSTSAASGRPFLFDAAHDAHVGPAAQACPERSRRGCPIEPSSTDFRRSLLESAIHHQKFPPASITPASRLEIRPAPEMASSGIPALDALTGGLPRGCLTELYGPASSGRTTVLLAALAAATRRGEFCALIDASDALDPHSAAADIDLDRLLWVRCDEIPPRRHRGTEGKKQDGIESRNTNQSEHRLEQVLRATDLLLESGGFGLIVLDLADVPPQAARCIPLTTWFRFRRAVEHKPTILLAIEQQPIAGSCSSLLLHLEVRSSQLAVPSSENSSQTAKPSHTQLLTGLDITMELMRSRLGGSQLSDVDSPLKNFSNRKPAGSVSATFTSKTAWG